MNRTITINALAFFSLFIFPLSLCAMEQEAEHSFLMNLPEELITAIVIDIPRVYLNLQEGGQSVGQSIRALSLTNHQLHSIVNDSHNTRSLVKRLHKKFGILAITAIREIHTKKARKQLKKEKQRLISKMAIITKYAFVFHNDLLQQALARNKFPHNKKFLTMFILDLAYNALKNQRKINPQCWSSSKDIEDSYNQLNAQFYIVIDLDVYRSKSLGMHHANEVAAQLLYLAEMNNQVMNNFVVNNRTIRTHHALFRSLNEKLEDIFLQDNWPAPTMTDIGLKMHNRIKIKTNGQ